MKHIAIAFLLGFIPNLMFALGTGIAINHKSPWPAWSYIVGGFIAYAIGIFISRRGA